MISRQLHIDVAKIQKKYLFLIIGVREKLVAMYI